MSLSKIYRRFNMNKGMAIWTKKKEKAATKRYTIKDSQVGLVRIVKAKYPTFKRVNGKNRFDKMENDIGVQVENRIYFVGKYIFANKKGVELKEIKDHSKVSGEILALFAEKSNS